MPVDQRRINGPEVTVPYQIYVDSTSSKTENPEKFLKNRKDGRQNQELRKIFIKTGVVSQAKGSAYIELGKTKVICSVFDPRDVPNKSGYSCHGNLYCEFKFASFSCAKRRIHQQDAEEKEFSLIMQRSLEPAVCRGIYADTVFLDPTTDEEELCMSVPSKTHKSKNHGIIMQASLLQKNQVSEFYFVGNINLDAMQSTMEALTKASENLSLVTQQYLVKLALKKHKNNIKNLE
ncbi:Similar to exosc6: Exosome complex component MTR3 (Danio rerio) [Cotesia congregata]|uniref:Similar to exosc6: Exosome complex component MTR3 (Danio rerio) n=1 Tax=Cotesia congregata TaxID=51543 RepID=A0A8J2MK97_COTCN|nr:Similar to exosc6: Exosome complex component MTR3 (Danio rerio) [Cotesia congregata]